MAPSSLSLLWFVAIIALIPLALWLLKRTPIGRFSGAGPAGFMRTVAALPLSPNQRLVTVEVGVGEGRRWLVLGVTAQNITVLYTMEPQATPPVIAPTTAPFAQLLARLQAARGKGGNSVA
jgi:flagellar protein FliO/FliZ